MRGTVAKRLRKRASMTKTTRKAVYMPVPNIRKDGSEDHTVVLAPCPRLINKQLKVIYKQLKVIYKRGEL